MASVFRFEAAETTRHAPRSVRPSAPALKRDVAATQEIQVDDILETAEELAPDPLPAPEPAPTYIPQRPLPAFAHVSAAPPQRVSAPPPRLSAPPSRAEVRQAHSVAPVAFDVDVDLAPPPPRRKNLADSTMQIILDLTRVPRRMPKRRLGWVVAMAVGVSVLILGAGLTRRALSSEDDTMGATLAAMVATQKSAAATPSPVIPKPTPAPAATSPASLAPSPVGTVVGPTGRVYIDGKQVRGTSAIVPCGSHKIRIAPATKAKAIDVPCGGDLTLN